MDNIYDILNRFKAASQPLMEGRGSKPDFLDLDRDGNRTEPMKAAAKEVDEASYSAKAARAGKDIGKPGKNFEKIAKSAGERYGSKAAGERVAGAVLAKMRAKESVAEGDVEEGNDFTGARLAAIKAGKPTFRVDGKVYKVTGDTSDEKVMEKTVWPGTKEYKSKFPDDMRTGEKRRSSTGGEIERTSTGVKHTAKPYDDEDEAQVDDGTPKKKGRPKGSKRALGAKGPTGKSKLLQKGSIKEASIETFVTDKGNRYTYVLGDDEMKSQIMFNGTEIHLQYDPNMQAFDPQESRAKDPILDKWLKRQQPFGSDEDSIDDFVNRAVAHVSRGPGKGSADQQGISEDYDKDEYDEEGEMAQSQARTIEDAARELQSILDADENLPEWVQKKISLAMDYIDTARDYLAANRPGDEMVAEKAVSKAQRAAAGIARAAQKGEIPRSELRGASKEMARMPAGELKKFAKTKEKGLPEKVKKDESVEENTVAGSVAPAVEAPKGKKGGMVFGKGVYEGRLEESYKSRLETMLTEGMSINMSVGEDGRKNLSVSATDDDAVKLAQILKLAGMQQPKGYDDACPTCGAGRGMCEHEMVEEADLANSADDTVYADTNYMTQTLAGGLNGPKLQVNPNNPADNPLSMRTLGQHSSSSLNLGSEADNLKEETERRLMDLYQRFEAK